MVRAVVRDMANVGHKKAILKSDNEPAVKALASQVKVMRSGPTILEESPEYELHASGIAERCVRTIRELFVTARSAVENCPGERWF